MLVSLGVWVFLYCAYWIVAEPYGWSFDGENAVRFLWWLTFPPAIAFAIACAFRRAARGESSRSNTP